MTRLLRWAERLLIVAGSATLVWCAVLVGDALTVQRQARSSLETAARVDAPSWPAALEDAPDAPVVPPPTRAVYTGSPIATLSIPRIQLSAAVLHGSDAQTLRHGPGHLEHTAFPGDRGNVVIAGHRDTFFWPLRNIRPDDDIFVETPHGRFHYRVTSLRVVNPRDLSVLEPTDDATLTLITCYPFWVLGHAPDRFVVRASRIVEATAAAIESRTLPVRDWIHVPVLEQTAVNDLVSLTSDAVESDETLVRQAVERIRIALNARLMSHRDSDSGGPLRFQTCEVDVTDNRATATCAAAIEPLFDEEAHVRTFMLERADGGWAVRSMVLH